MFLLLGCSPSARSGEVSTTPAGDAPQFLPESIVACGTNVPLTVGTPVLSSTLVGDDLVRSSCVRGSAPECVFILDVPSRSDVRLSLESADFDGALVLMDAHRSQEILCVDDSPTGDTHHTRIETTLGAGRYAVMVEGANGEAGQFALFAEVDPLPSPAEACAQAIPLVPGAVLRGSTRSAPNQFGASCASGADGPDRVHVFDLSASSRVRVWQQSEHDGALYLRSRCEDPSTELVCGEQGGERRALITAELSPGRYYLYSDSYGRSQSGDYVLSIEETATPKVPSRAQACARAGVTPLRPGELEIDTFYATSVLSGSCGGENAPERLFHLSLPEEKTIQIELLDPEFDAVVYLRVECDDERSELNCVRAPKVDASAEGEGGPSRTFAATIGPGEYTLGIDGQFENQMGAVRVRMTELPFSLPRGGR